MFMRLSQFIHNYNPQSLGMAKKKLDKKKTILVTIPIKILRTTEQNLSDIHFFFSLNITVHGSGMDVHSHHISGFVWTEEDIDVHIRKFLSILHHTVFQ